MEALEPRDLIHLDVAKGWVVLGNYNEANEELELMTPSKRAHPDVLEVRYNIYEKAERWEACLDIASAIVKLAPERSFGWIHRSNALRGLNRTKEALDALLPAVSLFPNEIEILFDLACYESVLGNMPQALHRLWETYQLAGKQKCFLQWQSHANCEPDLEAVVKVYDDYDP